MTDWDDPRDDMADFPSARDADRLLAGDPPSGNRREAAPLVTLLSSMRNHVAREDPEAQRRAIAALAAGSRVRSLQSAPAKRRRLGRRVPVKVGSLAFAAVLLTGTAAAAANGSLPDPVQRVVSSTLSHVHISVPDPEAHGNSANRAGGGGIHAPDQAGRGRGSAGPLGPRGPEASGTARYGLCTAAASSPPATSNGKRADSVAFSNLEKAASDAGLTTTEFCAGVTHPTGNTGPTGPVDAGTTTTTAPHGPPTSKPNQGPTGPTGHTPTTPTTKPVTPKGPTGPKGATGPATTNSGTAHQPDKANAS
ncbi:MAG: hypothetical protein QOI44_1708 [Actinomycetota bacterium]|nr:hypothetical protein [Actinomycetota bacterium]